MRELVLSVLVFGCPFICFYLLKDRLGSTAAVSDHAGNIVQRNGFDPFGKPRQDNWVADQTIDGTLTGDLGLGSKLTDRGFTGHEHIDSVGLIHMNGRGYDPEIGRFLSVDPFIQAPENSQSLNPYSYIMNNPLAGTDPSGYEFECTVANKCAGQCAGCAFQYMASAAATYSQSVMNGAKTFAAEMKARLEARGEHKKVDLNEVLSRANAGSVLSASSKVKKNINKELNGSGGGHGVGGPAGPIGEDEGTSQGRDFCSDFDCSSSPALATGPEGAINAMIARHARREISDEEYRQQRVAAAGLGGAGAVGAGVLIWLGPAGVVEEAIAEATGLPISPSSLAKTTMRKATIDGAEKRLSAYLKHSKNWSSGSLNAILEKFSKGIKGELSLDGVKTNFVNKELGIKVMKDNENNYFRIYDMNRKTYLDASGNIPKTGALKESEAKNYLQQQTHIRNTD